MEYRRLGRTGFSVSAVGIGGEYLEGKPQEEVTATMHEAMDLGVNILDIFMSEPNVRTNLGRAIKGRRDKIYIQGQICTVFENGQYGRTRDLARSKQHLQDLFTRLDTDYIDIGMVHYIDTMEDWKATLENGIMDYVMELRRREVFHSVGVSSHSARVSRELVKSGYFDVLMFSINPIFDFVLKNIGIDEFMEGPALPDTMDIDEDRAALYNLCEEMHVGITVMKTLGAGRLLRADTSPFRVPMSVCQCIHYALSRPAVASVLIGAKTPEEIREAAGYFGASESEKDYSFIFGQMRNRAQGQCMYCNHCLPCPAHIDIAAVTRLRDDAKGGVDAALRERYGALAHKASECIRCGGCEQRCPFAVPVMENMRQAAALFE